MARIEVVEQINDLSRVVWSFVFFDDTMQMALDAWTLHKRASRRHGWKAVKEWSRLGVGRRYYLPVYVAGKPRPSEATIAAALADLRSKIVYAEEYRG